MEFQSNNTMHLLRLKWEGVGEPFTVGACYQYNQSKADFDSIDSFEEHQGPRSDNDRRSTHRIEYLRRRIEALPPSPLNRIPIAPHRLVFSPLLHHPPFVRSLFASHASAASSSSSPLAFITLFVYLLLSHSSSRWGR